LSPKCYPRVSRQKRTALMVFAQYCFPFTKRCGPKRLGILNSVSYVSQGLICIV
jgi:hypothetical protein